MRYVRRDNTYCEPPQTQTFQKLVDAQQECTKDGICTMVYDRCGNGNEFYYCTGEPAIKQSTCGTILYTKTIIGKRVHFQ